MAPGVCRQSPKQRRSETLSLLQGVIRSSKALRVVGLAVLIGLPEKVRLFTSAQAPPFNSLARSEFLGRCRTSSGPALRRCSQSRVASSVRHLKRCAKCTRSAAARRGHGSHAQAFRPAWAHRVSARIPSAARCRSGVAGTNLCLGQPEGDQHSAWMPVRSWPAPSDMTPVPDSKPWRQAAPQSALSAAMSNLVATG